MFLRSFRLSSRGSRAATAAVLVGLVLGSLLAAAPAQAEIRDRFFGIHVFGIASGGYPQVETGSVRLWDSGTTWREIERSPGVFRWGTLDAAVEQAQDHGLRPMIVLGQTPRFHAKDPRAASFYGRGASSMPTLRSWGRYVGQLAHRYQDTVDYQIWNEPNVIGFWSGTRGQMAALTVAASRKINRIVGARATVVGPSFPLRLEEQRAWFKSFWQQSRGGRNLTQYLDVIAATLYPMEDERPEAQLPLLRFVRRALPPAGRHKPLWNTEINFGLGHGTPAKRISSSLQASYVARTLILNANSHIARVYWYSWEVGNIANTHLRTPRGRLTEAGRAWNVVHGWMVDTSPRGCRVTPRGSSAGLWTCVVRADSGEVRRMYWRPTGAPVYIRTVRSTRGWSNPSGVETARRGAFRLQVGRRPIMVFSRR